MGVGGNCSYFLEVKADADFHKRDSPYCAEEAVVIATAATEAMAFSIEGDTVTLLNNIDLMAAFVDVMRVTNTSGTFSGSFTTGVMMSYYSSASVPAGWLVPLAYIKVGRPKSQTDEKAKVRLIVPHSQGHTIAAQDVLPYYYEITYEKEA